MKRLEMLNTPSVRRCHDVAYWGLLTAACVVMLALNAMTPLKEDDMAFTLMRFDSLRDIWLQWLDHFVTTNGRFADVVAALFCKLLGQKAFDVCNALVFGLMAHLVTLLGTRRRSITALSLFLAFVGYCYPFPGETMLWLAGSCNYLWSITASLLLVRYLQHSHDKALGWMQGALLLVAAFIAGHFNEATSFGFLGGGILYCALNRGMLNRRVGVALAGYLLGVALIVASPGAWDRAAMGDVVINLGLGDLLSSRWHIFGERMLRFVMPALALLLGVGTIIRHGWKPVRRCVWTHILLCLAVVMFALGIYHDRAYAPLATVSFILVAMMLDHLLDRHYWPRLILIALCLGLSAYTIARAARDVKNYKAIEDGIIGEIWAAPRQAVLHERYTGAKSRFVKPMPFVSSGFFWREDLYCDYFGKENVQFVSDSIYDRFHTGRLLDGAQVLPLTTDSPDVVDTLLAFDGQDYMVALINVDSLPHTLQQARYYTSPGNNAMSKQDLAHRRRYGLSTEYNSCGFYPLRYHGRLLLVFPPMNDRIERIVFPIDHELPPCEVTISRLPATDQ